MRRAVGACLRRAAACLVLVSAGTGCRPALPATPMAEAEFLVVTDDSTAWVRAGRDTVQVLRAPMLVAELAGRLVEIYVAEDPIDFEEASFLVTRVYRRDLVSGDSALVFADSTVLREAMAWVAAHPGAERLDSEEELPPDEGRALESSITPLEVVGPVMGLEVHVDRTVGELGTHDTYRATVDLATGRRLALGDLVPHRAAADAMVTARQHIGSAVSLATKQGGAVGRAAGAAIGALLMDSLSFSLVRRNDSLAAQFLLHDEQVIDEEHDAHRYALEPVTLPATGWWPGAVGTLPREGDDSTLAFAIGTLALTVHADREDMAMVTADTRRGPRPVLAMRGPVRRLILVADSLIAPAGQWRRALQRAFSESGYYSDQVRAASLRNRARPTAARQAAL
ncbi:MAG: hypothetical protein IT355_16085 [Gemmatimonadaceae bacterium]|nr:hypothetical protein [Gemmatimonadaceae bacterium]